MGGRLVREGILPVGAGPQSKGPEKGTQKAFRGGGWMDSTTTMRAAMRNGTDPNTKINWLGFRCARSMQDGGGTQVSQAK